MFHLVLYQPEIPPNTGNIIRLCANTGTTLHLIEPLGFDLDDTRLRRAGLDYHEFAQIQTHPTLAACLPNPGHPRIFALSTRGMARYTDHRFFPGDTFLLGPETRGLPQAVLDELSPDRILRLPMRDASRSLNLSNAAAVIIFEAWRQNGFSGGR
ncbi:MAG: tRNA (cytidine(34)-2'-O)-methyltransferase [Woeseiaceae bacterium]|nr:tRNA (cytidine(34)-2'-O)-methyltransferase [Woeseiaceae bacterium]